MGYQRKTEENSSCNRVMLIFLICPFHTVLYAPINVKPAGERVGGQGMGWGFDCLCCPWTRAFD